MHNQGQSDGKTSGTYTTHREIHSTQSRIVSPDDCLSAVRIKTTWAPIGWSRNKGNFGTYSIYARRGDTKHSDSDPLIGLLRSPLVVSPS